MLQRYFAHLWHEMSATGRRTFPWDLVRGVCQGALQCFSSLFALYVAIERFEASAIEKSFIAGGMFTGWLLSLFYASWSPAFRRNTRAAALPYAAAGVALAAAAIANESIFHTIFATIAGICLGLPIPILTGIYRSNYRGIVRGQVYGIAAVLTALMAVMTGRFGSRWLDVDMMLYKGIYGGLAVCAVLTAGAILQIPATDIRRQTSPNPFRCFGAIRDTPVFGYVLLAWFIFGFSNLILMPQRVEYLAQAKYGFNLRPELIGTLIIVVPETVKVIMIPVWARLFDRFNFIRLRMLLNTLIISYFVFYFLVPHLWAVALGSVLLGAFWGGGTIAWNLWVTKFSPPDQTSRYMAVHTFFTGVRGSIAPFVGYAFAAWFGLKATACFSVALTAISIALLWRVQKYGEPTHQPPQTQDFAQES